MCLYPCGDRWFQRLPVRRFAFRDGHEIRPEKHTLHPVDPEQPLRQGGFLRHVRRRKINRTGHHHRTSRNEFERGGVGRCFGNDVNHFGSSRSVVRDGLRRSESSFDQQKLG